MSSTEHEDGREHMQQWMGHRVRGQRLVIPRALVSSSEKKLCFMQNKCYKPLENEKYSKDVKYY